MNLNEICNGNLVNPINKRAVLGNFASILKKLNKRKISFRYETQTNGSSSSKSKDVISEEPYDLVEGTVYPDNVKKCANGEYLLTMKTANRRKASPKGSGVFPELKKNSFLWRSYRLEGIDIQSLQVKRDNKWKAVFVD